MSETVTVRTRLVNATSTFLKNKLFADCRLVSSTGSFPCHRLVLASASQWFRDYFQTHSDQTVPLPFNDDAVTKDVVRFIYDGEITFTIPLIPRYCQAAVIYGIPTLRRALTCCLSDIFADARLARHLLNLVRDFVSLGIDDVLSELPAAMTYLSGHFELGNLKLISGDISPLLFSRILAGRRGIPPPQLIRLIDGFVGKRELSIRDRQVLESCEIDWTQPGAHLVLPQFHCGWLTAKTLHPMLNELINCRRKTIQNFERDAPIEVPTFNRWCVAAWLRSVFDGSVVGEMPSLEAVRFMATLGGVISPIDVEAFGFAHVTATPPLAPLYRPSLVLSSQDASVAPRAVSYYLSHPGTEGPFIEFNFDMVLAVEKVVPISAIEKVVIVKAGTIDQNYLQRPRAAVKELLFQARGKGEMVQKKIIFERGKAEATFQPALPCSGAKLTLKEDGAKGVRLLRLRNAEFIGRFLAE
jgi:hypothetical protein